MAWLEKYEITQKKICIIQLKKTCKLANKADDVIYEKYTSFGRN